MMLPRSILLPMVAAVADPTPWLRGMAGTQPVAADGASWRRTQAPAPAPDTIEVDFVNLAGESQFKLAMNSDETFSRNKEVHDAARSLSTPPKDSYSKPVFIWQEKDLGDDAKVSEVSAHPVVTVVLSLSSVLLHAHRRLSFCPHSDGRAVGRWF